MLTIKNSRLTEKAFSSFACPEDSFHLLKSLSEKADWSINEILRSISKLTIKSAKLRKSFRKFLIAQKYGIKESYIVGRSYVSYVSDECIIVESEDRGTSVVLNAQGDIKTDEGKVHINPNSINSSLCFISFGVNKQKGKQGLYSRDGNEILPCIFDSVESKYFPLPLVFEGVKFEAWFREESDLERFSILGMGKESVYYTYAEGLVKIQFDKLDTVTRLAPSVSVHDMNEELVPNPKEEKELIIKVFDDLDREMKAAGHCRHTKEKSVTHG